MKRAIAVLAGCLLWEGTALAGLKIYFLRHAQGGHNVVKEWKDVPKTQWPDYVGKEDRFSPLGEQQVATVAGKLGDAEFDLIAVSPLWRTRQTILPYLRQKHREAEIWPELEEFEFQEAKPPLPPPSERIFSGGPALEIPPAEQEWFRIADGATHRIRVAAKPAEQSRADVQALMEKIAARIRSDFGGTDKTILLVGHGNSGSLLFRELTGKEKPAWPENAKLWMIEEQPDGTFQVEVFNDQSVR